MKDYVLTIGIDKFYLTKEEKEFYVSSVENGAKLVRIGDMVLGVNFQSLAHKNVIAGKEQCDSGNWHTKGTDCYCWGEWKQVEDGKMEFVPNKIKPV